ncbi:MAG: hypothetical protein V3R33_00090 [Anaerolineales bacterium]
MKSMRITDKDWIQLSAYLDDELSGKELEQLQKRLKSDSQLQAALEELNATKQILKSAPQIPAPRRFTLTPEMVGWKEKRTINRGYRLAAALMSFLLIGVLILDFGGIFFTGAMSAVPSQKSFEVQLESMPESAADAVEEPALMDAAAEPEAVAGEDLEVTEHEEVFAAEDTPAEEALAVAVEAAEESLAEGIAGDEQEEKTLDADGTTGANRAQVGEGDLQNTQQALPTQTPEPAPVVIDYLSKEEIPDPDSSPRLPTLRILEILFGLGVIGFSAAAWFKRRKSS